jgi:hypothetical protein
VVTKRLQRSSLLIWLALSAISSASASVLSGTASTPLSPTPGLAEAPRDSLVAWVGDLLWLVEDLRADVLRGETYCVARTDSLQRRLDLAELRLEWERDRRPRWWQSPTVIVPVTVLATIFAVDVVVRR